VPSQLMRPAARLIDTSFAIALTDNEKELAELFEPRTEASARAWLEIASVGYLAGRAAI
jgi:hypothetical protein